jgi:hypothetical protein
MTERKPAGMRFESWVERQIREAQDRGEFDNLAGAGKPLPGLTGHYDDMWWVKRVVQREHLSLLPPMLALRKEAEELLAGLATFRRNLRSGTRSRTTTREWSPPFANRETARS